MGKHLLLLMGLSKLNVLHLINKSLTIHLLVLLKMYIRELSMIKVNNSSLVSIARTINQ